MSSSREFAESRESQSGSRKNVWGLGVEGWVGWMTGVSELKGVGAGWEMESKPSHWSLRAGEEQKCGARWKAG